MPTLTDEPVTTKATPAPKLAGPEWVKVYSKDTKPDPLVPVDGMVVGRGTSMVMNKMVPVLHVSTFSSFEQQNTGKQPVVLVRDLPVVDKWTPVKPTEVAWPFAQFAMLVK